MRNMGMMLAALAMLTMVGAASGAIYTDIDKPSAKVDFLNPASGTLNVRYDNTETDSYSISGYPANNGDWADTFGYNPATQDLTSADLYFWLKDDSRDILPTEGYIANVKLLGIPIPVDSGESSNLKVSKSVDLNGVAFGTVFLSLSLTGQLDWLFTVDENVFGDYVVEYVALQVSGVDSAVPEPASFAVWSALAAGGIAVCVWRRKRTS